ncbi:MAG: 2,3-bisphosphoglycerate-independent phosphoglycerate mutase [Candidatus Dojkabacteria bacterium]|nr:2,3-bisphosphoglycerate-independent phosphoglycerate mutase [Candidatus Dojkabacteria bacterium]
MKNLKNYKKVVLTIIDGWGIGKKSKFNAIYNAKTTNYDRLIREFPNTTLFAHGEFVGLPKNQFGTSEVNHLTIGSGRIIYQDLPKINNAIKSGEFYNNSVLWYILNRSINQFSNVHLIGILSDGGVHSHIDHLFALLHFFDKNNFPNLICLHLFTDGRDVAPQSAELYFEKLEMEIKNLKNIKVIISTVQGRSFLDRDRDWARTEKAFNLMYKGDGFTVSNWKKALNLAYATGITSDEQIGQYLLDKNGLIKENDFLLFFHFRTDRMYQIIKHAFNLNLNNVEIACFCQPSSEEFSRLHVLFPRTKITETLSELLAAHNYRQIHIAETEKYPHVTYFFNGECESPFEYEDWKTFESNRFIKPMYDLEPSMRNFDIAKCIVESIRQNYDFIVANFASPDMVGHTGNYNAAVVSAESVDFCLGYIFNELTNYLDKYVWIITADHGNSEVMWDRKNNQPHTQHTLSKVPFIFVSNEKARIKKNKSLQDIAPTILQIYNIPKSNYMTGENILVAY